MFAPGNTPLMTIHQCSKTLIKICMVMNKEHPRFGMTVSNYPQGQNNNIKMDPFFKFNSYKKHNTFVDLIFTVCPGCTKQPPSKVL